MRVRLYFAGIAASGTPTCSDGAPGPFTTALGFNALASNTGDGNTAVGHSALQRNTDGEGNTAVGQGALGGNTTGENNTALGVYALRQNTVGRLNTAIGVEALGSNTTAISNTAVGAAALANANGDQNTAVGNATQISNLTGTGNVSVGASALLLNASGSRNTAIGAEGLYRALGPDNTAVGWRSAFNLTDSFGNTAIGSEALPDASTGVGNIAIGWLAGGSITTGSHNIHIGYQGAANESDTIRIGVQQTRAFIRGIRGVTTGSANAVPVLIDSNGQLGTISSSRRTKEDIEDMGDASAGLFRLRPVRFRYIQPYTDGSKPLDYGLIAEEVEEVYPDLVVRNESGEVETVHYHKLVPMLLNELQRLRRELETERALIAGALARLERLESRR